MMSDEEVAADAASMMGEQLRFIQALYEVAMSSDDAETVRTAMSALTGTAAGIQYLRANPMVL